MARTPSAAEIITSRSANLRQCVQDYLRSPKNGWAGYCAAALLLDDDRIAVGIMPNGSLAQIMRHRDDVAEELLETYFTTPLRGWIAQHYGVNADDLRLVVIIQNPHR